jgi:hypothetical protein
MQNREAAALLVLLCPHGMRVHVRALRASRPRACPFPLSSPQPLSSFSTQSKNTPDTPKAALATKLDALATTLHDAVDDALDAAAAKKDPASTFDYIVVGSGPGGASVAAALSADPTTRVLLLEAGEDRDGDAVITGSQFAWSRKSFGCEV